MTPQVTNEGRGTALQIDSQTVIVWYLHTGQLPLKAKRLDVSASPSFCPCSVRRPKKGRNET